MFNFCLLVVHMGQLEKCVFHVFASWGHESVVEGFVHTWSHPGSTLSFKEG